VDRRRRRQHCGGKPAELEYPFSGRRYITCGWESFPETPAIQKLQAVHLPSPLFSWIRHGRGNPRPALPSKGIHKPFDLLLMPSHAEFFPPSLPESGAVRNDHLPEFARLLLELVRELTRAGLTVLHKPRDTTTLAVLRGTLEDIRRLGGPRYRCLDPKGSGLDSALLAQCGLVIWDQPGTGFLECLASGIPALICWNRVFTVETTEAAPYFEAMEKSGLIHRNPDSLIREIMAFKQDSGRWMGNARRSEAINAFCGRFIWMERRWASYWKNFLRSLLAENAKSVPASH